MSELVKVWSAEIFMPAYYGKDMVVAWQDFLAIVNGLTGVTVINSIKHEFPGGGFSGLVLIAESHAAIHTWPELNKAWVELATCGEPIAIYEFKSAVKKLVVKISHPYSEHYDTEQKA